MSKLNHNKSWNTMSVRHMEQVWKAEQKHKEELKKIQQLQKEIEEQKHIREIEKALGEKPKNNDLSWMYEPLGSVENKKLQEDYLLGNKRIDSGTFETDFDTLKKLNVPGAKFVQNEEKKELLAKVDQAAKLREDPLFEIKKAQMNAINATLNNPVKLAKLKKKKEKKEKKEKKKKKKKYDSDDEYKKEKKRKHKSDLKVDDYREKKRKSRDEERDERSKRRKRSRSRSRERSRSRSRERDYRRRDDERRDSYYNRHRRKRVSELSEEERRKRIEEMMQNAKEYTEHRLEKMMNRESKEESTEEKRDGKSDPKFLREVKSKAYINSDLTVTERIKRNIYTKQKSNFDDDADHYR